MLALVSLVVAVLLARYVAAIRTVIAVQLVLYALAVVVLLATAPDHDSTRTTGLVLGLVLAPVTALAVAVGRVWRGRSAEVPELSRS